MIDNLIACVEKFLRSGELSHVFAEGELVFLAASDRNQIFINKIYLNNKYQNKGILTMFLKYLAEHFKGIWFFQCNEFMSFILLTTCLDGKYFVNRYTGEHYWIKNNKNYDAEKSEQIYAELLTLKESLQKRVLWYSLQ